MELTLEDKTNILLGLFVSLIISANLLGNKITTFMGISFAVGIFIYPFTFVITDVIEEVLGVKKVKVFVITGLIALIMVLLYTLLAIYLPPAARFDYNSEYARVFGMSARIIGASIIAFIISQTHDMFAFNFWKKKTHGKYLWLRNNLSTIVSQFIDTTMFMFLAFYQMTPKFTAIFVFSLIIPYWLLKVLIAVIDTPLCYVGVKWLKGKSA
jgi:queuosine precursor transporter